MSNNKVIERDIKKNTLGKRIAAYLGQVIRKGNSIRDVGLGTFQMWHNPDVAPSR